MPARSVARPMTPSRASISRTRWPFARPPIAGLQDISPMVARRWVSSSVRAPSRAEAAAASHPACPPPITITSYPAIMARTLWAGTGCFKFHVKHGERDAWRASGCVDSLRRPADKAGMPSWWILAWPGICATVTGVGFARFSYTAIIPFLVSSGQVSAPEADYVGAAGLVGYFVGAFLAHRLALRTGSTIAIHTGLVLTILSLALSAYPGGFWWLAPW